MDWRIGSAGWITRKLRFGGVIAGLVAITCASPPGRAPRRAEPSTAPARVLKSSPGESKPALAAPLPPPAEPAPNPEPPSPDGWGTAAPIALVAADPARRWAVVCQARLDTNGDRKVASSLGPQGELVGDAFSGSLLLGPGDGEAVDAFAGRDPSGRYVAFLQAERLWLLDVQTGAREDLSARGAELRDDQSSYGDARTVSFDPAGRRMLFFRDTSSGERVVVRELATGVETELDPGAGRVWRATFSETGTHVVARMVAEDTNGNQRLEWPVPEATTPMLRCRFPIARRTVWDRPGDRAPVRLLPLEGGKAEDARQHLVMLARARVERHPDNTLLWRLPDGSTSLLARDTCVSRLVHVDVKRTAVMATCKDKKTGRHKLFWRTPASVTDLPLEMATGGSDFWEDGSPRALAVHAGKDTALYDAETGAISLLRPGDRILATDDEGALVLRGNTLLLRTLKGAETLLQAEMDAFGTLLRNGPLVAATPWVVDVGAGKLIGKLEGGTLALSTDGHGLIPARPANASGELAWGPLRWSQARMPRHAAGADAVSSADPARPPTR